MESIAALGLASNIVQIVDFSSRIISRGHELYKSANGRTEEHDILDSAASNLSELHKDLQVSGSTGNPRKLRASDRQLLELKLQSQKVVAELSAALAKARVSGPHQKWQSVYQALKSVSTDKDISNLANQLDDIRKQVDTAILVSLRRTVDKLSHSQSACIGDSSSHAHAEANQRHVEVLNAIRENNWQASSRRDITAFSAMLDSHTTAAIRTRFQKMILSRLYFPHMVDRADSIPEAQAETFKWLFEDGVQENKEEHQASFSEWLRKNDSNVYWIAGKPGSGKSTLMKYLYHHTRLDEMLRGWTRGNRLVKAGFYLWNSGSAMQMSRLGMLQALLYACFSADYGLLDTALPERWEQHVAFGGGQESFDWPELRRAFDRIISDRSRQYFFLIDGLDEFGGESREIIDFVMAASQPNVKLCVASRPWIAFEDAFQQRPSLRLEHLTWQDISIYVTEHFRKNDQYRLLLESEPDAAKSLTLEIVDKASGVFLWVYLVVQSLLEGLSNADRMSDLQARLDALPSDLEDLFNVILNHLEPEYFTQACESFRLLRAYRELPLHAFRAKSGNPEDGAFEHPTLLGLFYADHVDTGSSLDAPCTPLTVKEALGKAEQMRRRLNARCRGLLELRSLFGHYDLDRKAKRRDRYDHTISYLHRTARDFVESRVYWEHVLQTTGNDSFQADERWANANLWLQKTHPSANADAQRCQAFRARCVDSAITIQNKNGVVQSTYLDEVLNVHQTYDPEAKHHIFYGFERVLAQYAIVAISLLNPEDQKAVATSFAQELGHRPVDANNRGDMEKLQKCLQYYKASQRSRWLHRLKRPIVPLYK
ncbi:hypothetical protein CC86DRAFT_384404 [Ophiobolus disseminans]|uniref:Uncharacterized protein n=1 Tax=Ophiobolus disseminans TaxID=1469910 RepID=A0A6A6ZS08_9PLEO|nr:hypothetical protein CC86DRAFT_384404 [Ophiobolus disseminans]